jgi:DNA-nicking Smr family endonuclease
MDSELDLHGLRADEAKRAIAAFLAEALARGARCVRIVHGKGLRSKGDGPVLKQRLDGWLRRRDDVLAFCSARREHGGTGAVYVLLRASS